jgi:thiamine kinase-like enzyme
MSMTSRESRARFDDLMRHCEIDPYEPEERHKLTLQVAWAAWIEQQQIIDDQRRKTQAFKDALSAL